MQRAARKPDRSLLSFPSDRVQLLLSSDNVFGCHLDTLCHRENATIPKFVEKCIRTVERRGDV